MTLTYVDKKNIKYFILIVFTYTYKIFYRQNSSVIAHVNNRWGAMLNTQKYIVF